MKRILGLDIHGTIDHDPEFFRILSTIAFALGFEVHILTGEKLSDKLELEMDDFGIIHTNLFSIVSYHIEEGTEITWLDSNNPVIDVELWNWTKANYCKEYKVDLMIDDSKDYGEHFSTPYLRYDKTEDMRAAILLEFEKLIRRTNG
ncbi:MAG: hypothetical protein KAS32_16245 [Candidatus Peribacteraceae bacterium]|nr:hypothetical protein [Candidatus Peribacteraceae bacterium]